VTEPEQTPTVEVTVEWEQTQRRRARLQVPADADDKAVTALADQLAHSGRAGQLDEILDTAIGSVHWQGDGGRFGGRIR
jgi:hypothetical protein